MEKTAGDSENSVPLFLVSNEGVTNDNEGYIAGNEVARTMGIPLLLFKELEGEEFKILSKVIFEFDFCR